MKLGLKTKYFLIRLSPGTHTAVKWGVTSICIFQRVFFILCFFSRQNEHDSSRCEGRGTYSNDSSKCAKDCGPHKRRCIGLCLGHAFIHASPSRLCLIFFWISTGEELSQPTKHANKIIILIFWLWRPQSLTHAVNFFWPNLRISKGHSI